MGCMEIVECPSVLNSNMVGQAVWPQGVQGMWYQYNLFNENMYWTSTEQCDIMNPEVYLWSSLACTCQVLRSNVQCNLLGPWCWGVGVWVLVGWGVAVPGLTMRRTSGSPPTPRQCSFGSL